MRELSKEEKARIEGIKDQFEKGSIRSGRHIMDYMLFSPKTTEGEQYPLVLYLHGAGERGSDPRVALANSGGYEFASAEWQEKHPCYVLAPQVAEGCWWTDDCYQRLLMEAIFRLPGEKGLAVNPNRVYITGLSMGGMGTWKMIMQYPSLFAAAMPICGGGDPWEVEKVVSVPVWAFHAEDDPVVPAHDYLKAPYDFAVGSGRLVSALRRAGNPEVHYTEYPTGWMEEHDMHPHASWVPAYEDQTAKEWLFAQDRSQRYEIRCIQPGFYWIEDFNNDSIYLLEGQDKALVVDTGLAENDFIGMIKSLTKLPFELAVTHNHFDHMYHLDKFDRYYMNEKDLAMFEREDLAAGLKGKDFSGCELMPIKDGDIIDLGGGYEVEVFDIGGHTPGSVAFLDRKRNVMLTGDALGVWMQVPGATGLSEYQANLEHFLERISAPEYTDICMYGGHNKQAGGYFPFGDRYVPNDIQRVKDMITLCKKLLTGEVKGEPFTMRDFGKPAFSAVYGQATIVYHEDSLH